MKFLHISDLHYKSNFKSDPNFNIYKNHLFERLKKESQNSPFDMICFSGDLVYGGSKSEYDEFHTSFFTQLLSSIEVPNTACCFIPGNHDQDWDQLEVFSPQTLMSCETNEEFNTLMNKEVIRENLLKSFSAYSEFVNLINPPHEGRPDMSCYWLMEFNNLRVKVNGLNSSLLARFYPSDKQLGKMRLSETQILSHLKSDPTIDLQVTMSHYPLDYVISSEKILFENQLIKTGGIYLHGHIHEMSQMKIINKNQDGNSLLYCPVGPLYTKKEETGRFANSFNIIEVNNLGKAKLKSLMYASLPEAKWVPNSYSGKDTGIHDFDIKKEAIKQKTEDNSIVQSEQENRRDSLSDLIRLNPFLSSLDRSIEKKLLNESNDVINFISQYDIISKEIVDKMYEPEDNSIKQIRVLAYEFGKLFLLTYLTKVDRIIPSIQYTYLIDTLKNIASDKLPLEDLEKGILSLCDNLDFQEPFFEYSDENEAKLAFECFPFFVVAISLISFFDQRDFISQILGIEEAEEETWSSNLKKTTYNSQDRSMKFMVATKSKSSFVIVSLVKNKISRFLAEGDDSFKGHNLISPIISINLDFSSAPNGFREIAFSADVPKLTSLVMGRELYGENANFIFIRELIQNSIDAIRARKRLDSNEFKPKIKISYSEKQNTFSVEDNGVGMSKIEAESYLLKVGRSIWRSKRLNKDGEKTPESIGRFGIGFVSALYVSKSINLLTLRYSKNSDPFSLLIRSVEKPVYIDDEIEKKTVGTKIDVQLEDEVSQEIFNKNIKQFFLFHPDGINFDYPVIPLNEKEYIKESFIDGFGNEFDSSFLLVEDIFTISSKDSTLTFAIPSINSIDKWDGSGPNTYKITNGCVFVSAGSILYNTVLPPMRMLNKGLFLLALKEGKYNISARRNTIDIPENIISDLSEPLRIKILELYQNVTRSYAHQSDFFYKNSWANLKKIFSESIIKNNSNLLDDFSLQLTFEGKAPQKLKLKEINSLKGYHFLQSSVNIFSSYHFKIYKSLKPTAKFVILKINSNDNLLKYLVAHKVTNKTDEDFRTKIYEERLITEIQGHPLTRYLTEFVGISKNDFFTKNNIPSLFFELRSHPSIENIGMKREKYRRNFNPCIFINSNHKWTIAMSSLNHNHLNEETQLKIEQLIYWVLRSHGNERQKYEKQLSEMPLKLGLATEAIPL